MHLRKPEGTRRPDRGVSPARRGARELFPARRGARLLLPALMLAHTASASDFLQGDAAGPGMTVDVHIVRSTGGFTSSDAVTTSCSSIIVGPVVARDGGMPGSTVDGAMLSTVFFVSDEASEADCTVSVNGTALQAYGNFDNLFHIVTPLPAPVDGGTGDADGTVNGVLLIASSDRTDGGSLVLEDLEVPSGVTLRFDTTDPISGGGNEAYLPAIVRVEGDALIQGTIDVSGANGGDATTNAGYGGNGGPGGGGGGVGSNCLGATAAAGNGFAGGGGTAAGTCIDYRVGGTGAYSAPVNEDGGNGIFTIVDNGALGYAGGTGGAPGAIFGTSGGGGYCCGVAGNGGYGGGGGNGHASGATGGPGGGGWGTSGENGDGTVGGGTVSYYTGGAGLAHGNDSLVPLAGGSGGGGGDSGDGEGDGGGGGGGGGAFYLTAASLDVAGALIDASGGAGGDTIGDAYGSSTGGGGGSGGTIFLGASSLSGVTSASFDVRGGVTGTERNGLESGDGGEGRVRIDGGLPPTLQAGPSGLSGTTFQGAAVLGIDGSTLATTGPWPTSAYVYQADGSLAGIVAIPANASADLSSLLGYRWNYVALIMDTGSEEVLGAAATAQIYISPDPDDDGVDVEEDNCPDASNSDQADLDGDGIGDVCDGDADGDTFEFGDDCDDFDAEINPSADEVCDGLDNDCDGTIDADAIDRDTWYTDADADGYGDPDAAVQACSQPDGTAIDASDCDDSSAAVHPGADEVCNGIDDNCDGTTDSDAIDRSTWYADADSDGYGDPAVSTPACTAPAGYVADATDCDDSSAAVHPGASEVCNGIDDNCDGTTDSDAVDQADWYADADSDGYGDPFVSTPACSAPAGYVAQAGDCDDSSAAVHPGADEVCNGIDDDCDGTADIDAIDRATWYRDADGDGYGDPAASIEACAAPDGYLPDEFDCDDSNAAVHPGAAEVCNGIDDDCDDTIDSDAIDRPTWYADADSDGYGDPAATQAACTQPAGYVGNLADCDDTDLEVHPGADEVCNEIDDDCDDEVDEEVQSTFHPDADEDGFGDGDQDVLACEAPEGTLEDGTDCDDALATVYPGALETCDDGVDQDCNGYDLSCSEADQDGDGYAPSQGDCDDTDSGVHPDAEDIPYDGIDQDCANGDETDVDDDGYEGGEDGTDCNDNDAGVHPGADEIEDGIDNDCDGETDEGGEATPGSGDDDDATGGDDDATGGDDDATGGDDDATGGDDDATGGDDDATGGDDDATGGDDDATGGDDDATGGDDDASGGDDDATGGDDDATGGDDDATGGDDDTTTDDGDDDASPTPGDDDGGEGCSCNTRDGASSHAGHLLIGLAGLAAIRRIRWRR